MVPLRYAQAMSAALNRTPVPWTEEEYLDREENAAERHDFIDGQIYLMAGSSYEHSVLCANMIRALGNACGEGCTVHTSDMRVRTASGRFYYTDVSMVCGRPELLPPAKGRRTVTLLNPLLIVEVLSASTEEEDRGDKFDHYRTIPTLQHYVLVAQNRAQVEHFSRAANGDDWLLHVVRAGQKLRLPCGEFAIDPLYRGML